MNKGGPGIPHKSEEGKIEDDPPHEFLDAVSLMRAHRRKSWHKLCQKEVTRAIKSLGDDEDDTKGGQQEKELPSEHGASSSEEEDESKEYKEEEGKKKRPAARSPARAVTPTSPGSSAEEENQSLRHISEPTRPK